MLKKIGISVLFFVFLIVERQIGARLMIPFDSLAGYIAVFIFIYVYCRIRRATFNQVFIPFLTGFVLPEIAIRFIEGFSDSVHSFPKLLVEIIAMGCAWWFYSRKQIIPGIATGALLALLIFSYDSEWRHFINHGNFTGVTDEKNNNQWQVYDQNYDTVSSIAYRNKVMVLDFWNTSCPVCFTKFPLLQKLYDKYGGNSKVLIQAINVPIERDTVGMAFELIKRKGYTFPVVVAADRIDSMFNISGYPTTIVLVNEKVVFRGDISRLGNVVDNALAEMITPTTSQ